MTQMKCHVGPGFLDTSSQKGPFFCFVFQIHLEKNVVCGSENCTNGAAQVSTSGPAEGEVSSSSTSGE